MNELTKCLVVTVHGIRTLGSWQEKLENILKPNSCNVKCSVRNYKYGYFDIFSFCIPLLRKRVASRFARQLANQLEEFRDHEIFIVSHSCGTFLTAMALKELGRSGYDGQINTVIFSGSVLSPDIEFDDILGNGKIIRRIINDCGTEDAALLPTFLLPGVGPGGRFGIHGFSGGSLTNRFFPFGHSGYFEKEGKPSSDFMKDWWLPIILSNQVLQSPRKDDGSPSAIERILRLFGEHSTGVTTVFYLLAATIFVTPTVYFRHSASELQKSTSAAISREAAKLIDDGQSDLALALIMDEALGIRDAIVSGSSEANAVLRKALLNLKNRTLEFEGRFAISNDLHEQTELIAVGFGDGTGSLVDLTSLSETKFETGLNSEIYYTAFSKSGENIIFGSEFGIAAYNVGSGDASLLLDIDPTGKTTRIRELTQSQDGRVIQATLCPMVSEHAAHQCTIKMWDIESATVSSLGEVDYQFFYGFGFADGRNKLVTGNTEGAVEVLDITSRKTTKLQHTGGRIEQVAMSNNGHYIVTKGKFGTITKWNASGEMIEDVAKLYLSPAQIAISDDGNYVAVAKSNGHVEIFPEGKTIQEPGEKVSHINEVQFFNGSENLFWTDEYSFSKATDTAGRAIDVLSTPTVVDEKSIQRLRIGQNGKFVVGSLADGTIQIFDVNEPTKVIGTWDIPDITNAQIYGMENPSLIAFSHDGYSSWLVISPLKKAFGSPLESEVNTVPFPMARISPDSSKVAVWNSQISALWDVRGHKSIELDTGRTLSISESSLGELTSMRTIRFSRSSKYVAAVTNDGWSAFSTSNGQEIPLRRFDPEHIESLSMSVRGNVTGIIARSGRIHLWNDEISKQISIPIHGSQASFSGGFGYKLALLNDGNSVVAGIWSKIFVYSCDWTSGVCREVFQSDYSDFVTQSDSKLFVRGRLGFNRPGSWLKEISLWRVDGETVVDVLDIDLKGDFILDDPFWITATNHLANTIRAFDLRSKKGFDFLFAGQFSDGASISGSKSEIVAIYTALSAYIYDQEGKLLLDFEPPANSSFGSVGFSLDLSNDASFAITTSANGVRIWHFSGLLKLEGRALLQVARHYNPRQLSKLERAQFGKRN